jgi:hypothetical protein
MVVPCIRLLSRHRVNDEAVGGAGDEIDGGDFSSAGFCFDFRYP